MRLYYACRDCGRATYCDGLADVPDPPRCWTCHAVAVLAFISPNPILVEADRLGASALALEMAHATHRPVVVVVCSEGDSDPVPLVDLVVGLAGWVADEPSAPGGIGGERVLKVVELRRG